MPPPDRRSRWPRLGYVGRWLGIGLGGLVNILNPRIIVLGGPHGRIHPFVRDILEAELAAHSLPAPRAQVRVVPAALGIDAPLVGAAELAFEPLLADPAAWFQRPGGDLSASRVPDRWSAPIRLIETHGAHAASRRMKGVA